MDGRFRVKVVGQTQNPQRVIYAGMHQCYAEGFVCDSIDKWPDEERCGQIAVEKLLAGHRGHFSPLEAPQITFNCGYFPHSVMQQITRHRHLSFSVQSNRYTGQRIIRFAEYALSESDDRATMDRLESLFYLRPVGEYTSRDSGKYKYTESLREYHLKQAYDAAIQYRIDVRVHGVSEEHARGLIPFDVRQHWVMSANVRSLMHLLDLRAKDDAQLECQWLCELIWPHFEAWVPEIAEWYKKNRWKKARLAP